MRRGSKQISFWDFNGFKIDANLERKLEIVKKEVVAILKDIDEKVPKLKSSTALKDIFENCGRIFDAQEHIIIKHKLHNYWKCTIKVGLEKQDINLILATGIDKHKKKAVTLAYKGACSALLHNEKWCNFFITTMLNEVHIAHHPQNMIALIPPLYNTKSELFDISLVGLISQFLLEEKDNTLPFDKISLSDDMAHILQKYTAPKHTYQFVENTQRATVSAHNFR